MSTRSKLPLLVLGVLSALGALVSSDARADVVMSAPTACPTGSYGVPSHAGPYCQAADCADDQGCERFFDDDSIQAPGKLPKEPMACVAHPLCITRFMVSAGRLSRGDKVERQSVVGNCSASGACAAGSCTKKKVCIPRRLAPGGAGTPPPLPDGGASSGGNDAGGLPASPPTAAPPTTAPPTTAPPQAPASPTAPGPADTAPAAPVASPPPATSSSCGRCAIGAPADASTAALCSGLAAMVAVLRRRRRVR